MSAFCYYQANKYTEAIATADHYISLHPGSKEVAYAFYLKAISLYEQIVDVQRDQANTEGALVALQDVVQRFPDTEYARDATLKIDLTLDHLAGKEMAVGRYYLNKGDYIGAINRFRVVVEQYQRTPQIAEALERLTEAYYALGVYSEAQTAAAVLGANYPGSPWYKDAYKLLKGGNMKPEEDKGSWISQAFSGFSERYGDARGADGSRHRPDRDGGAGIRRRPQRADRRDRRRQIHPARCLGPGGRRPRRRTRQCAPRRGAGLGHGDLRAARQTCRRAPC